MTRLSVLSLTTTLAMTSVPVAAQDLTTVDFMMPVPRSIVLFPLVVGETLGYFEEEGLSVNLLPSSGTIPYVAFLENGQADIVMLDPIETLSALHAGAEITSVFEVMQTAAEGVAVRADSEVQSMADLAGTTVGLVTDRDSGLLSSALNAVGLGPDDVNIVVVGDAPATLAASVRNGDVSAITGSISDWVALESNGIPLRMITPEELMATPANSLAVDTGRMDELQPVIEGFLRAWAKGIHVAEANPEAVSRIMQQVVPEEWEDMAAGQAFLDQSIILNVSITEQIGGLQTDVWTKIQPQLVEGGLIPSELPVDQFLNGRFLDAANDWDRAEVAAEAEAWLAANP
jgi:NitT/TauT family transport system substrate-binding protein